MSTRKGAQSEEETAEKDFLNRRRGHAEEENANFNYRKREMTRKLRRIFLIGNGDSGGKITIFFFFLTEKGDRMKRKLRRI